MSTTTTVAPVLEPAAQAFAAATANPPFLSDLPPSEGRALLDEVQSGDIAKPDVEDEWITVAGGPTGEVKARIVRPRGATGTLPVILYQGVIHDFVMLNALRETHAADAAIRQAIAFLSQTLAAREGLAAPTAPSKATQPGD